MFIRFNGFEAGGWGAALQVEDMPSPEDDVETDRTDVLGMDGQVAGKDYIRKSVWNITLLVNTYTYDDGMAVVRQVRDAWLDPAVRLGEDPAPMDYSKDGLTWHRVYGRPVKYGGPPQGTRLDQGVAHIELQFEQLRVPHYSVTPSTTRLGAVAGRASLGWATPFQFPLVSGYLSDPVDTSLTNDGNLPAPLTVTFGGAMTEPRITNLQDDVVIGIKGELRWDERITVDALNHNVYFWRTGSPGARTPAPGRLIRQSRLKRLNAAPGVTDWQLRYASADDGFAVLSINSAYSSMQ